MSCVNAGGEIYTVKTQEQKLAFYGVSTVEDRMNIHFLRLTDETLKGSLLCQIVSNVLQECVKLKRKGITILERHFDDKQKDSLLQINNQGSSGRWPYGTSSSTSSIVSLSSAMRGSATRIFEETHSFTV